MDCTIRNPKKVNYFNMLSELIKSEGIVKIVDFDKHIDLSDVTRPDHKQIR